MSNNIPILVGITLFVSADNKCFAFITEDTTKSPLNAFIPYYVDLKFVDGVIIIKLSLLSHIIQAYILLATGSRMYPLISINSCAINHLVNYSVNHPVNVNERRSEDVDDELSHFIEDDNIFKDFTEFAENSVFNNSDVLN